MLLLLMKFAFPVATQRFLLATEAELEKLDKGKPRYL